MKSWTTACSVFAQVRPRCWLRTSLVAVLIYGCSSASLGASPNSFSAAHRNGCDTLQLPPLALETRNAVPQFPNPGACAATSASLRSVFQSQQRSAQPGQTKPEDSAGHRFWDRENDWLFAAVGAGRTLDYFSTLNFRRRGVDEAFLTNDIVDNHAAFAAIEAGGTAVSIGVSYLFHRYGHHRLERWTSIVHASLATGGAVRNYGLKAHR
jgi:hypothetical protein